MKKLHSGNRGDIVVATLGSGSRGNCTYIGDDESGVLIDCGLSTKQIRSRLADVGLSNAPIDAVLVTHEHGDHVSAARVLSNNHRKLTGQRLPFYMTAGTVAGLNPKVVPTCIEETRAGETFRIGGVTVEPFAVPHDTQAPVAYAVEIQGVRIGVITDLGKSTTLVTAMLASLDYAVLEFNHSVEMLMDCSYPWAIKQRIRSSFGHLSNEAAGELLTNAALRSSRLKTVVLAHLSEENNTEELAQLAADEALFKAKRSDISILIAKQASPIGPFCLTA